MDGGGTRWLAIGDTSAGDTDTITTWTGAVLTNGGVLANNSDRARKADFTAVDGGATKSEVGQRHLGPVAQDFYAALGLGADDKHITMDEGGVHSPRSRDSTSVPKLRYKPRIGRLPPCARN